MEWTKYTTKEALKDNDELMILDTDGKANKRTLMDKIWDYVVDKMTTAVIAKLGTTNKTLIGAVNELNSNKNIVTNVIKNGENWSFYHYYNCFLLYSATDGVCILAMLCTNKYTQIIGEVENINIECKSGTVTITNNMGYFYVMFGKTLAIL